MRIAKLFLILGVSCFGTVSCSERSPDYYLKENTPQRPHVVVGKVSARAWDGEEEAGIAKLCKDAKALRADAVINITRKREWSAIANQEVVAMEGEAVKWR